MLLIDSVTCVDAQQDQFARFTALIVFLFNLLTYLCCPSSQHSHAEAITSHTMLRLKVEDEEMQQEMVELKLKRDHARAKLGGCMCGVVWLE